VQDKPEQPTATRRRPRDRRQKIIEAAIALFADRGYQAVAFADVAEAVDVTPAALYRYFHNKEQLFVECVRTSAEIFRDAVDRAVAASGTADHVAIADELLKVAFKQPNVAVLYLREAAYLPKQSADLEFDLGGALSWSDAIRQDRPGLDVNTSRFLALSALGVLAGTIGHKRSMSTPTSRQTLRNMMTAVVEMELDDGARARMESASTVDVPDVARSRREATLEAAVGLFRRNGFEGVGVDQIGEAAGVTGSAIYRHFRSKEELLVVAFRRTGERFRAEAIRTLEVVDATDEPVRRLVASYTEGALDDEDLLFVYMHEARNLPPHVRREMSAIQNELLSLWVHVITTADDNDIGPAEARTIALAAIGIINAAVIHGSTADPRPPHRLLISMAMQAIGAALRGGPER
jgi:AcrR family transcriptional regulator